MVDGMEGARKKPVLAVLGRSNTGKSSLCRLLAPQAWKAIKVGKYPGVTKGLREVDNDEYTLIDLPGFGYMMHVSKKFQDETQDKIISFIEHRHKDIFLAIQVINLEVFRTAFDKYKDISVPFDKELFDFLQQFKIPTIIIANKVDKLRKQEAEAEFAYLKEVMNVKRYSGFPAGNIMQFSAKTELGFDVLKKKIIDCLEAYKAR